MLLRFVRLKETQSMDCLAVALGEGALGNYGHVGIIHRTLAGQYEWLHLKWHNRLAVAAPGKDLAWVCPGMAVELQMQVAARCRRITKRRNAQQIPYALLFKETIFGQDGSLLLGKSENGLTCSTFVLAVFHSVGVPLLNLTTWQARNSDDELWCLVVQELEHDLARCERRLQTAETNLAIPGHAEKYRKRSQSLRQHLKAIRSEKGCVRYRPEEVAAASASSKTPLDFADARVLAETLVEEFVEASEY